MPQVLPKGRESFKLVVGWDLEPYISDWHWDGKAEVLKVWARYVEEALGHLCLQHAKKGARKRCKGGYVEIIPLFMDLYAFLPRFAFHICISILLDDLTAENHTTLANYFKGEMRGKSLFSLIQEEDGLWSARWKSSFQEVTPFKSSYSCSAKESDWRVDHLAARRIGGR